MSDFVKTPGVDSGVTDVEFPGAPWHLWKNSRSVCVCVVIMQQ